MADKLYETSKEIEKVVLIAVDRDNEEDTNVMLDELEELVKTSEAIVIGRMVQKREGIHSGHYFGKGKIEELKSYVEELGATGVVCDDDLSPVQMRNLNNVLGVKIMSRTLIILDIFARHAVSAEGKVQVELAQLKYNRSHLVGFGKELSRLGGGIGTRGPGEKKLETDRRLIDDRISELKKELKEIEKHRNLLREKREKNGIPIVALAGYTNAGKSTLMNTLTQAGVLVENKLFATLDTTTRKLALPSGSSCLFTDTVGFVQKLPHSLVEAFKATLEEVKFADIIIHVVDASNDSACAQIKAVYKTLEQLECLGKPIITVYNKTDKDIKRPLPREEMAETIIEISAKYGKNIDVLLEKVEETIKSFRKKINVLIPYSQGGLANKIHSSCDVMKMEHNDNGIYFEVYANEEMTNRLAEYMI